ncbi:MAG: replication factor C large subunit [Candidatus Micrarchaeota archaeon]
MLWTQKYAPMTIDEVVGNADARERIKVWALEWGRGNRKHPLLIAGPPGIGKTCVAHTICNSSGWDLLEINATDTRNKKNMERLLGMASTTSTLSGNLKLIFIDEVDGSLERGGGSAIYEITKNALQPMILVANNPWKPSMAPLRTACTLIEMRRVNVRSIGARLRKIVESEGISIPEELIEKIAHNNNGDMRSAINDLQSVSESGIENTLGDRDRRKDIFHCLRNVFKSTGYWDAKESIYGLDVDWDMYTRWVEENIPREYDRPEDVARAFDSASRADVFKGRIRRRQYWGLMRYCNDLLTAGIALSKEQPYHRFVKYSFPQVIKKLSASKSKRAKEKKVLQRIGAACHVSVKRGREYLPLVKLMLKKHETGTTTFFRFDEDDITHLVGKRRKLKEKGK